MVERHVYTVDVIGSSPVGPTKKKTLQLRGFLHFRQVLLPTDRAEKGDKFIARPGAPRSVVVLWDALKPFGSNELVEANRTDRGPGLTHRRLAKPAAVVLSVAKGSRA